MDYICSCGTDLSKHREPCRSPETCAHRYSTVRGCFGPVSETYLSVYKQPQVVCLQCGAVLPINATIERNTITLEPENEKPAITVVTATIASPPNRWRRVQAFVEGLKGTDEQKRDAALDIEQTLDLLGLEVD